MPACLAPERNARNTRGNRTRTIAVFPKCSSQDRPTFGCRNSRKRFAINALTDTLRVSRPPLAQDGADSQWASGWRRARGGCQHDLHSRKILVIGQIQKTSIRKIHTDSVHASMPCTGTKSSQYARTSPSAGPSPCSSNVRCKGRSIFGCIMSEKPFAINALSSTGRERRLRGVEDPGRADVPPQRLPLAVWRAPWTRPPKPGPASMPPLFRSSLVAASRPDRGAGRRRYRAALPALRTGSSRPGPGLRLGRMAAGRCPASALLRAIAAVSFHSRASCLLAMLASKPFSRNRNASMTCSQSRFA
jgi:hypothetical protein